MRLSEDAWYGRWPESELCHHEQLANSCDFCYEEAMDEAEEEFWYWTTPPEWDSMFKRSRLPLSA